MKKLLKLFLCLLMFISFTNIAFAQGGEEVRVTAKEARDQFIRTNFFKSLLYEAETTEEEVDPFVVLDEENHKIKLVDDEDEVFVSFDYNDDYIAYRPEIPNPVTAEYAVDSAFAIVYVQNMMYAVLDCMGYSNMDAEIPENTVTDETFFQSYGVYMDFEHYEYVDDDGTTEGEVIKEIRISLIKSKIESLLQDYGTQRTDYLRIAKGEVFKPVVSAKKKGATIVLTWGEDEAATKYYVYRSTKENGTYKKIATVYDSTYTDKKVTYGVKYYYKVKADSGKKTKTSDIKSFKLVPDKVQNVKLTAIKTNSITVNYDKVKESGYSIYRSTDGKTWTKVTNVKKNSILSYKDTGLKANKKYYYRVRAYKTVDGEKVYGPYSEVVNYVTAPAKPTLTVKVNTPTRLKLTIGEVKGATRYEIMRSTKKDGTYTNIGETATANFYAEGLKTGKTYYFKVRACNKNNKCSGYSAIVGQKVEVQKPKISLETGKTIPMTIKTTNLKETETYEIWRATSKDGTYKRIALVDSSEPNYVDLTAKLNKTYYYKVRSYVVVNEKLIYSAYSKIASLKCLYSETVPEVVDAESADSFNGVYASNLSSIKIYNIDKDKVYVHFNYADKSVYYSTDYSMTFEDGELKATEGDQTIKLTTQGVLLSGESLGNGYYYKYADYTFDKFFADNLGSDEYLDSMFTGKFVTEDDTEVYLYRWDENTIKIRSNDDFFDAIGELYYEDGVIVGYVYEGDTEYKIEVSGGGDMLIIQTFVGDDEINNETFIWTTDFTKEDIVDIFFEI